MLMQKKKRKSPETSRSSHMGEVYRLWRDSLGEYQWLFRPSSPPIFMHPSAD